MFFTIFGWPKESRMTMKYLGHLATLRLPCQVFTPSEINALSVLRAAGLIMAFIPPPEGIRHGATSYKPATVLAITEKGRLALQESAEVP